MWIKLHTAPKKYRNIPPELRTPRQKYYFNYSLNRYSKTDDGVYVTGILTNRNPEIGKIDNIKYLPTILGT